MLIWINGPFGVGKTQTAFELHRRLPGSLVTDPERPGFGFQSMLPPPLRGDFQDLTAWRDGVVEVLEKLLRNFDGDVIVPMTVIRTDYFEQIVGRLRAAGHDVRHFALLAQHETVLRRLRERVIGQAIARLVGRSFARRGESFAVSKLDAALAQLVRPEFAEPVWTDHRSVAEVVDHIAGRCGLTLRPDTDSAARRQVRRAWVGVRHIRLT